MKLLNYHYYLVVDPNGKELISYAPKGENGGCGAACYYTYNYPYKAPPFGENLFYIFICKEWENKQSQYHSTISQDNLEWIINKFTSEGFPVKFVSQNESYYTICLDEKNYYNRSHLRVFLDFFRIFWEGGANQVGFKLLSIPLEVRNKYDILTLCQICYLTLPLVSGHGLIGTRFKFHCHTNAEILSFLKSQNNKSYNEHLSTVWESIRSKKQNGSCPSSIYSGIKQLGKNKIDENFLDKMIKFINSNDSIFTI